MNRQQKEIDAAVNQAKVAIALQVLMSCTPSSIQVEDELRKVISVLRRLNERLEGGGINERP